MAYMSKEGYENLVAVGVWRAHEKNVICNTVIKCDRFVRIFFHFYLEI